MPLPAPITRGSYASVMLVLASVTLVSCGSPSSTPSAESTAAADSKWQDASGSSQPAHASSRAISCSWAGPAGGQHDSTYCQRVVDDELRRSELTPDQRADAEAAVEAVVKAIDHLTFDCAQPVTEECLAEQARRRIMPATDRPARTVEQVRQALTVAGFADVTVRTAGQADPAPRDTIVYAVPIGTGCVVGHLAASGQGAGQQGVLGTLPDGRCLA
ncbi:hypothetical protein [Micromonospora sp. SL4-19]|uniref:hypothetical protein n=1 Tax=Micromonospora sp. SL4-19 TaxID=3399129 RepID=UPI003A4DE649